MKIGDTIRQCIEQKKPFYSLEFFPPKDRDLWPEFMRTVAELDALNPLFLSVTYGAGGSTRENTLDLTTALAARGVTPMAHLTCVGATPLGIREFLHSLAAGGVYNILALRGDTPKNCAHKWEDEAFPYASDLVRFVRQEFPEFGIAVAAYPYAHPESPTFAGDRLATVTKMEAGSDFAVTQLFFDHREYFDYVEQMRKLGVTQPILPGVLPIQSLDSIRRVLALSGCSIPAKLYLAIEEAHAKGGAAAVKEAGIVFAVEQIRRLLDCGAPGIHLYTLNKAEMCLRIAEAVKL